MKPKKKDERYDPLQSCQWRHFQRQAVALCSAAVQAPKGRVTFGHIAEFNQTYSSLKKHVPIFRIMIYSNIM